MKHHERTDSHSSSTRIYGELPCERRCVRVTAEEILAVEAYLEGLEIIDVARDADGDALDPHFTWSFDLYGGTASGGDVLDYIAMEV